MEEIKLPLMTKPKIDASIESEIEIGKIYHYFDDGKLNMSRRMECIVTDIIPFDNIDLKNLINWLEEVENCNWLYSKKTDYFIKADLTIMNNITEKIIFVRTIDNNWFSLGWWGGMLDIDGSLNRRLENIII